MKINVCRFCKSGNVEALRMGAGMHAVACHKCSARGPVRHSAQEAIKAWNGKNQEVES